MTGCVITSDVVPLEEAYNTAASAYCPVCVPWHVDECIEAVVTNGMRGRELPEGVEVERVNTCQAVLKVTACDVWPDECKF